MVHINIARRFLQSKPEIKSIRSIIEHTFCKKIIINPEFHNVNSKFCGAIHSVNWANISVLSQVIRNVNERKTVQTNIISFVSHGTGILKICEPLLHKFLLRSPAECPANRNIIFRLYRFSFHKPIKSRLVRGRLYLPFTP